MYFKDLICKYDLRQVPEVKMQNVRNSILLIGSGRLARHLQHWNSLLQLPNTLITWNRSESLTTLNERMAQASLIWLAISDSAIIPFYNQHLTSTKITAVHFSGALNDPRLLCAHPLMSFPHELLANTVYPNIHFSLTGSTDLQTMLPGFKNSSSVLPAESKALYHALCVVAGNFPQLLWSEAFPQFKNLQIPEKAFDTYIHQITENFIQLKNKAVTGPLVRKDLVTIAKNQAALEDSKLNKIYSSFAETFIKEPNV